VLIERALEEFNKMEQPQQAQAKTDEELALDKLAASMTEAMNKCEETFMLSAPATLTVRKANGGYSKVAHVGMEDFQPVSAYVGKRGKMIFVFKPVMVADYLEMEMDEQQAFANLSGFKDYLRESVGDLQKLQSEIKVEMAKKAEEAKLADRFDTYKDIGFGSW
jgi:ribosomal protein S12